MFKTTDQPAVVAGNWTAAGFCFLLAMTAAALAYLQHSRAKNRKNLAYEDEELESNSDRMVSKDRISIPNVGATKASVMEITTQARV